METNKIILYNRIDVFIKILYIKAFIKKEEFKKYKELYKKHINLYNWWYEDHKRNINDFEKDFNKLIKNIKDNWFNNNYPILINEKWIVINWSHRLACCLYFWITPVFKIIHWKWIIWDINWLYNNKFENEEIIEIINCYTDYKKDFFIYIIWPSLFNKYKDIKLDLQKIWNFIWSFEININKKILSELIKDIYSYDDWNLKWGLGIDKKIILLNNSKIKKIIVLVFEKNNNIYLNERGFKDKIRNKYKKYTWVNDWTERFYTFHSWEDQNENNYIKKIILNIKNLESLKYRDSIENNSKLINNLDIFRKYCKQNNLNKEDFCIVWSTILEIYNLRKANDLDFISNNIISKKNNICMKKNRNIWI